MREQEGARRPPPTDLAIRAIKKHWPLAFAVAIAVMAAVTFYTVGEKQIFRATATLQIDPNPTQPLGTEVQAFVDLGAGSFWTNREYYATQYKIIAGRSIASETVRVLGLARDAAFMSNASPGKRIAPVNTNVSIDEAADVLISRLKVEPVKDSRLAVVTYDDANKDRARLILAAHIEIYSGK